MWSNIIPVAVLALFTADWLYLRPKASSVRESHDKILRLALSLILTAYSWTLPKAFAWGMTLSFIGDLVLASVPFVKEIAGAARFPLGMLSFAAAHVFYTSAFINSASWSALYSDGHWLITLGILQVIGITIWYSLVYDPRFRERIILAGALVYSAFISTMAATALSAAMALGGWWVVSAVGALFFILSDSLLGSGELTQKLRLPDCSQYVWLTYLIAQSLLFLGAAMAQA